jgi:hypothetical protein
MGKQHGHNSPSPLQAGGLNIVYPFSGGCIIFGALWEIP